MVNYSYYKEVYYGNKIASEQDFNRLQGKAVRFIEQQTFNRSKKVTDKDIMDMIKITVCELIDNYIDIEKIGTLKSVSLDDYSYSNVDSKDLQREQMIIIDRNLINTGLLYTGVGRR